jgi:dienelactone hydrolase
MIMPWRSSCGPLLLASAALWVGTALAQRPPDTSSVPDNPGTGPYPAMKEEVTSLPGHVLYRPRDLAALGKQKLGVVAWGNGGCSDDGASTRFPLLELASHGYLVIASGHILSGPGAPPGLAVMPPPRPNGSAPASSGPRQLPPPKTKSSDLTDAIDWALAQNHRQGGAYFGRISPQQIAVSGWSCGGLQALKAAQDPRVHTAVLQNTGIFIDGPSPIPGMDLAKSELLKLHTPVLYILGGPTDIAYANGMDDFKRIEQVPVAVANIATGHGGTYFEPNGGPVAAVAVAWLQWQLRGDRQAAASFVGMDCGLCKDPKWTFQKKRIP